MKKKEKLTTAIWHEKKNKDNPFHADECYCHGYNLLDEIATKATFTDYLFLLFTGTKPNQQQSILLEKVFILLANPGIRSLGVRASMNAAIGGAPVASWLNAANGVNAGLYEGAEDLKFAIKQWRNTVKNNNIYQLKAIEHNEKIWPQTSHIAGFDIHSETTAPFILKCLNFLIQHSTGTHLSWFARNIEAIEKEYRSGLSIISIFACAFLDLELNEQQSQSYFLIIKQFGAAAHGMEQQNFGWQKYPFFNDTVTHDSSLRPEKLPDIQSYVQGYLNEV